MFSEHLYICLSVLALLIAVHAHDRQGWWLVTGLCAGLAVSTRTIGWMLVLGILIHLLLSRKYSRLAGYLVGTLMGVLPLYFFKAGLPETPSYLNVFLEPESSVNPGFLKRSWDL